MKLKFILLSMIFLSLVSFSLIPGSAGPPSPPGEGTNPHPGADLVVWGYIKTISGDPIINVLVTVNTNDGNSGTDYTDSNGYYSIGVITWNEAPICTRFVVTAQKDGYITSTASRVKYSYIVYYHIDLTMIAGNSNIFG